MATVVVALGGSLLRPEVKERHKWLEDMVSVVKTSVSSGVKLAFVVGGGAPAREGIELARPVIHSLYHLDKIGIAATRLNATIVREAIAEGGIEVSENIPKSIDEAVNELSDFPVVVMGGTVPGHTTDAVAIRLAIQFKADKCIIATNVAKVHSEDPRENPFAESFERLTLGELQEIVGPPDHADAGSSKVVDPIGVREAVENGLPLDVLDGRDPRIISSSINGEDFEGTTVTP